MRWLYESSCSVSTKRSLWKGYWKKHRRGVSNTHSQDVARQRYVLSFPHRGIMILLIRYFITILVYPLSVAFRKYAAVRDCLPTTEGKLPRRVRCHVVVERHERG
jgi:hypothetical protein